jgi:hypothetical protein
MAFYFVWCSIIGMCPDCESINMSNGCGKFLPDFLENKMDDAIAEMLSNSDRTFHFGRAPGDASDGAQTG